MTNTASSVIRFMAVDDNILDLMALSEYAKGHPFLKDCGGYSNILEALEMQKIIRPDVVFLDIEMPGTTGIELLRQIRKEVPIAVFITSHAEFALEGFELSALDYVLKPLTEDRFAQTAGRIRDFWDMKQKSEAYEVMFDKDMLTIREGHNQVRLAQRDIVYLEAMQDYTKIVTTQKNYLTLSPLSYFLEKLPSERFSRIHRSYAIALSHIRELRAGEVVCGNSTLPIGKTYRSTVSKLQF